MNLIGVLTDADPEEMQIQKRCRYRHLPYLNELLSQIKQSEFQIG